MAYIKVDHSKFSGTAQSVETYVNQLKRRMSTAEEEIKNLAAVWQGADYTQFKQQWDRTTNGDATYTEMVEALEAYAKFLKYAAEKYKDAQAKAINRANSLPRY